MSIPVIVMGAGGHAKVLIEALGKQSVTVMGITSVEPIETGQIALGVKYLGSDDIIFQYSPEIIGLVNGVGTIGPNIQRRLLFEQFKKRGYTFIKVIHPAAVIASDVKLGEGVQIMAGCIIQPGSQIGRNCIINTKVSIDHDCYIGDHVHLAPGVTLSGGVEVAEGVLIGAGATVIQGVKIGRNCIIGAGTLVLKDIPDGATVTGVPGVVRL